MFRSKLLPCIFRRQGQCAAKVIGVMRRLLSGEARTAELLKRRKVRTVDLAIFKKEQKPITMVTAYDYPSALHVDLAGFDILLVGDSLGMVQLGMDTTVQVTMDDMIHHSKAVVRGAKRALTVCDMPFGSCEGDPYEALRNAQKLLKEGGVDAVKIEGGMTRADTVKKIVDAGIAVIGHVGLQPQHISVLGGFRAQGQTADAAALIIEDALAIQEAGACAIVIECVPSVIAQTVTELLDVPTIGIGAGPYTSGQVLVFHDLLGFYQHKHSVQYMPKFCKQYANVSEVIRLGLEAYRDDVESGEFPDRQYSPYKMHPEEHDEFLQMVQQKYGPMRKFTKEDAGNSSDHNSIPRGG